MPTFLFFMYLNGTSSISRELLMYEMEGVQNVFSDVCGND